MRTALLMLLWLGVLTAVAIVIPQAPNVPSTIDRWLTGEEGPGAGVSEWLWRLGAFIVNFRANTKLPFSVGDSVDHPVSLYAANKKANKLMAHTYSHVFAIPTTGLRFFTVYGPWGRPDVAPIFFTRAILTGEPIELLRFLDVLEDARGVPAIRSFEDIQPGDVRATWADVGARRDAVGFSPTTIEAGVERFVAWYRKFYG